MPTANPTVVLREEFDDWGVLFDPDSGKAFGLNPTSAFIWKQLDGKHSIDEIAKGLSENFEEVAEDAHQHVQDFVKSLVDQGMAGYVETK